MKIKLEEVQYSIIYDVDIYCFDEALALPGKERPVSIKRYEPRGTLAKKMWRTEDSNSGYLDSDVVAHGKWCGVLTYDEFQQLLMDTCMRVEEVRTMGSLGAPGFDFGWAPAICFRAEGDYYLPSNWMDSVMAYVTPLITNEQAAAWELPDDESAWDFIQKEMWAYAW